MINKIFANIEYFRNAVRISAETNRDIWHENYANNISQSWMIGTEVSHNPDWDVQVDYFATFLKNRIAWMNAQQFNAEEAVTEESVINISTDEVLETELPSTEDFPMVETSADNNQNYFEVIPTPKKYQNSN